MGHLAADCWHRNNARAVGKGQPGASAPAAEQPEEQPAPAAKAKAKAAAPVKAITGSTGAGWVFGVSASP
eukprot:13312781-Alexandrium_andersonii.AAC.1